MGTLILTAPASRRVGRTLARVLGAAVERLRRARRLGEARRVFETIDDRSLRDLGISRGEFASHWAESEGLVEATRLRVVLAASSSGVRA